MARRIAVAQQRHAWVVLEQDGRVAGYAYAAPVKDRAAYRWACEVSVYLEPGRRRGGAGRALYEALFERLAARGLPLGDVGHDTAQPGERGTAPGMGFEPIGVQRRIGWKNGDWHDVGWVQRSIGDDGPPVELR